MFGRLLLSALIACGVGACIACTNQNPDQIRQKTAEGTAALKRDMILALPEPPLRVAGAIQ